MRKSNVFLGVLASLFSFSAVAEDIATESQRHFLHLFNPTYILPYYYTSSPYEEVYTNNTPDNQKIMSSEFKGQLSFYVPLVPNLFGSKNTSINAAYTQLSYWQVYASSQYFRETNYEPELFVEHHLNKNWFFRGGVDHQSNGRGGTMERSWNRAKLGAFYKKDDLLVGLTGWGLIFTNQSSELHNPDIAHYLGHENLLVADRFHNATISLQLQNIESGLSRGFIETSVSYPLTKYVSLYVQYFNGYGQSLIEYNHRTQGAGIGFDFSSWLG
jgi:phospholipase A1